MNPKIKSIPFPPQVLNGKRMRIQIITTKDTIEEIGVIEISTLGDGFLLNVKIEGSPAKEVSFSEEIAQLIRMAPLGAPYDFECTHPDIIQL